MKLFSVEWFKDFENIDLYEGIGKVTAEDVIRLFGKPNVIWENQDCSTFSIAAISHHRRKRIRMQEAWSRSVPMQNFVTRWISMC